MSEFTQGVYADGAAILKDGVMLTVEEIIELLRDTERLNWLIRKLSGKVLREVGVIYSAGSESFIRAAIDSAIKGEG